MAKNKKDKKEEEPVQFTFRWSSALDELFRDAHHHKRYGRPYRRLAAQALKRCLPFPKDRRPDRINGREPRNIEIVFRIHARVQRVADLPGREDDPNNFSAILIEAISRLLFFRAGSFEFDIDKVRDATGYGNGGIPPQQHYDVVKDVEELLEDNEDLSELNEQIEALLDSNFAGSPNSLNQAMSLAQRYRAGQDVESWIEALKKYVEEFQKGMASQISQEFERDVQRRMKAR
jgi:hypothetical protein